jgi:hypothetical protein
MHLYVLDYGDVLETTAAGGTLALRPTAYESDDGETTFAWFDLSPRSRRFDVARITRDDAEALEWEDSAGRHLFLRPLTAARVSALAESLGLPSDLAAFVNSARARLRSA